MCSQKKKIPNEKFSVLFIAAVHVQRVSCTHGTSPCGSLTFQGRRHRVWPVAAMLDSAAHVPALPPTSGSAWPRACVRRSPHLYKGDPNGAHLVRPVREWDANLFKEPQTYTVSILVQYYNYTQLSLHLYATGIITLCKQPSLWPRRGTNGKGQEWSWADQLAAGILSAKEIRGLEERVFSKCDLGPRLSIHLRPERLHGILGWF